MRDRSMSQPRCLDCGYILHGLAEFRCPECGREFDPEDPESFSIKPPFVRWKFWLPGLLLAFGAGTFLWLILFPTTGVGVAVTIVVPFSMGAILGYSCRRGMAVQILLGLLVLLAVSLVMLTFRLEGIFCALILGAIALGPLLIGSLLGILLRIHLKRSSFDQRDYLPILLFVAIPLGWGIAEHFVVRRYEKLAVATSTVMPVPAEEAWASLVFYEQVKHSPPLLLRLGLSRPLYSYGKIQRVGDQKTCVYDQGTLVKRVTRIEPGKVLEFQVVHQGIENCAVRLKGGSFRFESLGAAQTRVTLTTEYEPFLAPRWAWRPWEELCAHTLHRHVLTGMSLEARRASGEGDLPSPHQ
jgi:hypothetical protein